MSEASPVRRCPRCGSELKIQLKHASAIYICVNQKTCGWKDDDYPEEEGRSRGREFLMGFDSWLW